MDAARGGRAPRPASAGRIVPPIWGSCERSAGPFRGRLDRVTRNIESQSSAAVIPDADARSRGSSLRMRSAARDAYVTGRGGAACPSRGSKRSCPNGLTWVCRSTRRLPVVERCADTRASARPARRRQAQFARSLCEGVSRDVQVPLHRCARGDGDAPRVPGHREPGRGRLAEGRRARTDAGAGSSPAAPSASAASAP